MARLDGIIDISHHQSGTVDFAGLRQLGIVAVIHKATQGTHFIDSQYATRRKAAESAGLLWGAYHFGEEDSKGADQAAFFLSKIGEPTGTFVCLDFETYFRKHDPVTPHTMSLADAHDFVDTVHERLGRVPFFYSGATIRNVLGKNVDQKLATCPLWAAGYVSEQNLKIQASWANWTLWQYTDGKPNHHPNPIPGHGSWDRSVFDGTEQSLRAVWAS